MSETMPDLHPPPSADGVRELPEEIEKAIEALIDAEHDQLRKGASNASAWCEQAKVCNQAREALTAAILSRLGEAEAGQWRPIETAPKAWRDEAGRVQYVWLIARYPVGSGWTDQVFAWRDPDGAWSRWQHHFPPTHWMEAPKPPALTEAGRLALKDA